MTIVLQDMRVFLKRTENVPGWLLGNELKAKVALAEEVMLSRTKMGLIIMAAVPGAFFLGLMFAFFLARKGLWSSFAASAVITGIFIVVQLALTVRAGSPKGKTFDMPLTEDEESRLEKIARLPQSCLTTLAGSSESSFKDRCLESVRIMACQIYDLESEIERLEAMDPLEELTPIDPLAGELAVIRGRDLEAAQRSFDMCFADMKSLGLITVEKRNLFPKN